MPPPKPAAPAITDEQLVAIWKRLDGTTGNVYKVAAFVLGKMVGDEIFDELRKRLRVFRCESCSMWLPLASEATVDLCIDCHDGLDEADAGTGEDW